MSQALLVVADTDSYVKWGAALASQLPPDAWRARVVVVATPAQPSARQLDVALAGSRFAPSDVEVRELHELGRLLADLRPDAVLLALRGPLVRVVVPVIDGADRPVLVSGFPGLTIPAEPKAIVYRERVDLIVLHSRREVREFGVNAGHLGVPIELGLATLPFLRVAAREPAPVGAAGSSDTAAVGFDADRTDLVFAAQAKVPAQREDRVRLLGWLADAARRRPHRRVVVKVRARAGEAQTHAESYDYGELLADPEVRAELGGTLPPNLVVEDGPMAEHLARASALVTVSSTAVLEAVAEGVPSLVIDEFGVAPKLINTVFVGSGLFGGAEAVVTGAARHPDPSWLDDNYFHGPDADDWLEHLEGLLASRQRDGLPPTVRRFNLTGGALRRAFERKRMLGHHDRSLGGGLAMAVAVPARWVVRRVRRLRARLAPLRA
ncbi:DUF6716 putative glycosyltransferase [Agromyces sp. Soil535]|uniref:DUF6716 putative glycosyltransferase n=1 Tax=Agromyces sp. Soil535 TaxID=1736390 RepID=UPI0007002DF4|nr:DUF6716 putative glycosyltransferase [Agromyces sp. Soil535]KRE21183.1 hypothetical protein ASG80_14115 [Agromyces sp. Soil535]